MMSMKGDGKPVSFIEDCAVPLDDLAEYTARLDAVFARHGTYGTWYAHASVGTLHVRPVLNLKQELEVRKMRAIAEEAFAMVREYKGSHSGEHGDGIVRSEFHEPMFGSRIVRAFEAVKDEFDPAGLLNPGKIVRPAADGRSRAVPLSAGLSDRDRAPGRSTGREWGGFAGAVEMCNNNGACRKTDPGVMCPSYRATFDEQHVTRGRANTLRLALSGRSGPDALASEAMRETMELCISCKGCKRECPVGVDMARMKIEFLHHYRAAASAHACASAWSPICRAMRPRRRGSGGAAQPARPGAGLGRGERAAAGLRRAPCPAALAARPIVDPPPAPPAAGGRPVVLLVDTFNRWFEPENARAAERVLRRAGYRVHGAGAADGRPLCCGRTFLASASSTRRAPRRGACVAALAPLIAAGRAGRRARAVLPPDLARRIAGAAAGRRERRRSPRGALLFEEFVAAEAAAGRFELPLRAVAGKAVLHTPLPPEGLRHRRRQRRRAEPRAGARGRELRFDLLRHGRRLRLRGRALRHVARDRRARRAAADARGRSGDLLVAAGTSCRHQIRDAAGREALHPARLLDRASGEG